MRPGGIQGQTLDKIPEGSFKKKTGKAMSIDVGKKASDDDKLASMAKSMKLSDTEMKFLK